MELALNGSDIERVNRAGKMAAVLDLEAGFDLDGDLDVLRSLHRLGLRVVQLPAHNWANKFADSCFAPARRNGPWPDRRPPDEPARHGRRGESDIVALPGGRRHTGPG